MKDMYASKVKMWSSRHLLTLLIRDVLRVLSSMWGFSWSPMTISIITVTSNTTAAKKLFFEDYLRSSSKEKKYAKILMIRLSGSHC